MTPSPLGRIGRLAALLLAGPRAAGVAATGTFTCEIPTEGCVNGMFNVDKCQCECIPPYCLYEYDGSCSLPSGACENPWKDCTRGVDCPWWINPQKDETCTTGPKVPASVWDLYNSQAACCNVNFLYSNMCLPSQTPEPTKFPTIRAGKQSFEVIPLKFFFRDMPDGDLPIKDLKKEMVEILKRILLRLATTVPGLAISSVEERIFLTRNLLRRNGKEARRLRGWMGAVYRHLFSLTPRELAQDLDLYFNVKVVRDPDGKRFAPIIVQAVKGNFQEIVDDLQSFAATRGYGPDISFLRMNFCTSEDGQFVTCEMEIKVPTPAPVGTPVLTIGFDNTPYPAPAPSPPPEEPRKGLAGWAIALIFAACLFLFCCVGYFAFVALAGGDYDSKEVYNNFYANQEKNLGWTEDRSERSSRSRRGHEHEEARIVLAEPRITHIDDSATSRGSRRSERTRREQLALPPIPFDDGSISVDAYGASRPSTVVSRKPGRDPTFYVLGQEDRPDPESEDNTVNDVGLDPNFEAEDPPIKPGRDPTMYHDTGRDPTMYGDGSSYREDPPLKPKRDPTMYEEREGSIYTEYEDYAAADPPLKPPRDATAYSGDQMGKNNSDFSFGLSFFSEMNNGNGGSAGHGDAHGSYRHNAHETLAPSGQGEESFWPSFATQEPKRNKASKRSRKSKKSRRTST